MPKSKTRDQVLNAPGRTQTEKVQSPVVPTIPAGSVILGGALGKIQPGEKGNYEATFGELGTIAFELK